MLQVTCVLSSVLLFLTDVVRWRNVSHNALCHIMDQSQSYAPEDKHTMSCADKWLLSMCELLPTCLCPLWGQWWSETSQPCGTCGLIHSLVSAHSCTPSPSEAPSEGKHKGHNKNKQTKNMSRSLQDFFFFLGINLQSRHFFPHLSSSQFFKANS